MSEKQFDDLMGAIWGVGALAANHYSVAFGAWLLAVYFWFVRGYLRARKERRAQAAEP